MAPTYAITLRQPNGHEDVIQCPADQYILDAAQDAGLSSLPYSCNAGKCSSCCARVVSGKVDNEAQLFLDKDQVKRGFALLCVSYPESDCTILTHQEEALYFED
ncbi:MAG: 2Fe-2S iron-sulfur cluster-binding protein [Cyanobacteriota bacterium]|nr:2Fe-2S iron-sulfur cluster-binding protein [Cyanobacteriota bacterium]